jgi:hypothetical protein
MQTITPNKNGDDWLSTKAAPSIRSELRDTVGWPLATLRYELAYQQRAAIPGNVTTWGPGRCGHYARGSGFCAKCLQAEIDRRPTARDGGSE